MTTEYDFYEEADDYGGEDYEPTVQDMLAGASDQELADYWQTKAAQQAARDLNEQEATSQEGYAIAQDYLRGHRSCASPERFAGHLHQLVADVTRNGFALGLDAQQVADQLDPETIDALADAAASSAHWAAMTAEMRRRINPAKLEYERAVEEWGA